MRDSRVFSPTDGLTAQRWGIRYTLDTRFDTASITRLFTSVAGLQLVGRGTLDLEKPDYSVIETKGFLPQFAYKKPTAEPGVDCRYCNVGCVLVVLAIERVTGSPHRHYVVDEVFTGAGMLDSGFYDRRDAVQRVAEGWDLVDGSWVQNTYRYPPIGSPDGGVHIPGKDLVRFMQAVRGAELLNSEFTVEFFLPQMKHDETTVYGLGLEFDLNDDGTVRSHHREGMNAGASGIVRHFLDKRLDIAVLSHLNEGAWPVIRELDERLGGQPGSALH